VNEGDPLASLETVGRPRSLAASRPSRGSRARPPPSPPSAPSCPAGAGAGQQPQAQPTPASSSLRPSFGLPATGRAFAAAGRLPGRVLIGGTNTGTSATTRCRHMSIHSRWPDPWGRSINAISGSSGFKSVAVDSAGKVTPRDTSPMTPMTSARASPSRGLFRTAPSRGWPAPNTSCWRIRPVRSRAVGSDRQSGRPLTPRAAVAP